MRIVTVFIMGLLCLARAGAQEAPSGMAPDAPFDFDTAPGRLPKSVVPLAYTLDLVPDLDHNRTRGHETVQLDFRQQVESLQFNSLGERLDHVRLDGRPVARVDTDDAAQLTTVTLGKMVKTGRHVLTLDYTGTIETRPFGLYLQQYRRPDGTTGRMLSSKFEATDARRMFPCWDEPAFRATLRLTMTIPANWSAVANMPMVQRTVRGATARVSFETTPRMPSYLVEFSAGELAALSSQLGATRLGVWAVRGQEARGQVALANAELILRDYNDYFGYPFPLPKLDSIAIPGGFSGAMENWGAITYNDQILLVTEASTLGDRQSVFSTQAHEMAHQWNGDLVTMGWWDDLWLNESFASWRAAKETDLRHGDWHWWEVLDQDRETAMDADARLAAHPIRQHVSNELDARNAFDWRITYNKGQSVLRMLETYIGPDTFRDGIQRYIKAHALGNSTSADLWLALELTSHQDIRALAEKWTTQPGFPVIRALASCDSDHKRTVTLTQERFLLEGADQAGQRWQVPLRLRVGTAAPQSLLLSGQTMTIAAGECTLPFNLNADAIGYFRVDYDPSSRALLATHFGELLPADRIAPLDDQWAFAQRDPTRLREYLTLVDSMGERIEERAWEQIIDAFDQIDVDEEGTPGHEPFVRYARAVFEPLGRSIGWSAAPDEPGTETRLRRHVILALGLLGEEKTMAEAERRFDALRADPSGTPPDEESMILTIVGRHANSGRFDQIRELARNTRDDTERERAYRALMIVADPALARRAAELSISDEIPPQAATTRLEMIARLARYHPQLAYEFFSAHSEVYLMAHPQYAPAIIANEVPRVFWNAVDPHELEGWVRAHTPAAFSHNVDAALEVVQTRLAQRAAVVRATDEYLAHPPRASTAAQRSDGDDDRP
jgi:aminopeptidase N